MTERVADINRIKSSASYTKLMCGKVEKRNDVELKLSQGRASVSTKRLGRKKATKLTILLSSVMKDAKQI